MKQKIKTFEECAELMQKQDEHSWALLAINTIAQLAIDPFNNNLPAPAANALRMIFVAIPDELRDEAMTNAHDFFTHLTQIRESSKSTISDIELFLDQQANKNND